MVIEEVFNIGKEGVMIMPMIPISLFEGKVLPKIVELRFKNGEIEIREVQFSSPRISPQPEEYQFACLLKSVKKENIEIGTEVWGEWKDLKM